MRMIIAHEWYSEYALRHSQSTLDRDWEADAIDAGDTDEKVYE
jgi:hypothetical protein